jgi:hypothetical protein
MDHICNYCEKNFKSKSSLNYHIKTAKSCIQKRPENLNYVTQIYKCNFCNKDCTTQYNLNLHLMSCKEHLVCKRNEDIIKSLEEMKIKLNEKESQLNLKDDIIQEIKNDRERVLNELKNLQDKLAWMANHAIEKAIDKPSITNEYDNLNQNYQVNNKNQDTYNTINFNNLPAIDLSDENLKKTFEKLTPKHVCDGQNGLAAFVNENLFRDSENRPIGFCTDKARQALKYKGLNNEIIRDPKAFHIASKIAPYAEKAALRVKDEFMEKHYKNLPPPPEEDSYESESDEEDPPLDIYSERKVYLPNNFKNSFLRSKLCKMVCRRSIFQYNEEDNQPILRNELERNRYESIISRLINKINTTAKIVRKKRKKKSSKRSRHSDSDSQSENEYETDYEKYLDGIEEEDFFAEEDLHKKLDKLNREKNENLKQEKAEEIVISIEEKEWPQEKKDFYLQKLINGIQDYQILTINLCNFSKRLSMLLPSEN